MLMPSRLARFRPTLRIETLVALVVLYLVATFNAGWWLAVWTGRAWTQPSNWGFVFCCFVAIAALHFISLAPLTFRWTVRPLLTLVVIGAAAISHFQSTYHVMIDPTMIANILKTDVHEALELMSVGLFGSVLLWSLPALALIWLVRFEPLPWTRVLLSRAVSLLAAFGILLLSLLPISRDLTSFMRTEREARYLITPGNLLWGTSMNVLAGADLSKGPRVVIGADARIVARAGAQSRPRLFVLVVGETARAANFSLFGYQRPTNPELAKRPVLAFAHVTSCGTSTEVSLPCMFSPFGRVDYDSRRIRTTEGLLDVLVHAGVAVQWLDNQSGCKGVCRGAGVEYQKLEADQTPELCSEFECHDEVLVRALAAQAAKVTRDTVIVLHMMGNHGPAYYRRHPRSFRRFTPDCATAQLRDCTREQVVNSYDNAIAYTDFVLAKVVDLLAAKSKSLNTGMLYVSDHGESLGESGLYLHGMPYSIAPDVQTHVPMISWLSEGLAESNSLRLDCARGLVNGAYSHDNLFDTVLGVLDVQTSAYRPQRDVFAPCRAARPPA